MTFINQTLPQEAYVIGAGASSTNPFVEVFQQRDPTGNDVQYPIQKRWYNQTLNKEWMLVGYTSVGTLQAIWELMSNASTQILSLTGNTGGPVLPTLGNINVIGDGVTATVTGNPGTSTLTISLIGTGVVESFAVDAATPPGTNPVMPTGGIVTLEGGATFATGTRANPIRTNSLAASTIDFQIQLAGSNASVSTPNNFGVAQFDSTDFTVTGGFVQLVGGAAAISKVNLQTGTTPIVPTAGAITFNGAAVAAGTNPVRTDGTGVSTMQLEVQTSQALAAADGTKIGLSNFNNAQFTVGATGFVSLVGGTGPTLQTLSDDVGTKAFPDLSGNIQLVGHVNEQGATKFSTTVQGTNLININPMSASRWIVDKLGFNGTHTTIAAAITSATSGDTIQLLPGVYSENLSLKPGVSITAWGTDSSLNGTGNVIISGNATLSTAGSVTISGIQLQTNSGNFLTVSGSAASIVNLNNCFLNCLNNTGISFSSSSASSAINLNSCYGDFGTTGIALYTMSSVGNINAHNCHFMNTGATLTVSTNSAGTINFDLSVSRFPFSTSAAGVFLASNCVFDTSAINTTFLTLAGTAASNTALSYIASGSASTVVVGSGTLFTSLNNTHVSTNTNIITGAGSLVYSGLSLIGSQTINVTTQTGGVLPGGRFQAPSAGYIGEQIRAFATAVATSTGANTNITSISLTPGIWDISCVTAALSSGFLLNSYAGGISTSATSITGTQNDNWAQSNISASAQILVTIPSWRTVITATTIYYLNGNAVFSSGTTTLAGRISATRVG